MISATNGTSQMIDLVQPQQLRGTTYLVKAFGCQMNLHDAERVRGILESAGSQPVQEIEDADIVVYITCCVREAADIRLYGQVQSIKNLPPREGIERRIVAIGGCIGQRDREELFKQIHNVDVVFGTHTIPRLLSLLVESYRTGNKCIAISETDEDGLNACSMPTKRDDSFHAWVPITFGCNNFCTYCIVPYVRGRETSRDFNEVINEIHGLVDEGVKEITLLGQNVNSYGRDLCGSPKFAELLREVGTTGIERIRFATSHPKDLSDETIEVMATTPSIMPYLHLPAQSGSSRILKLMNRTYDREGYMNLIRKVRTAMPSIALSTDLIVGFPGETEEDFLDTLSLVEEVGYSQAFTFIYSKRAGTPAAVMENNVSREEIQDRFNRLVEVVQAGAYKANQPELDTVVPVLVEGVSKRDETMLCGRSPKNQTVHAAIAPGSTISDYVGKIIDIKIDQCKTWYLSGRVVDSSVGR